VRDTVTRFGAPPERLVVIYLALHRRFDHLHDQAADRASLAAFDVVPLEYLLYPANFWPHKNHAVLVRAFELYVRQAPNSRLKLVLTGGGGTERPHIVDAVRGAGLADRVVFAGFVSDAQIGALMRFSFGLIFPSLYEGFGMPVVEAMAAGTPILCSNATSLPEIAGDAALLFDPRDPGEISGAIAQFARDPSLRSRLTARGTRRLATFGSATQMAERYWRVICEAAASRMLR
jgi:glycosyltransferase involved in cell wall biosynthesis